MRDPQAAQDRADKTHFAPARDEACVCGEVITQNSKRAQVLTGKSDPLTEGKHGLPANLKDRKYFWA